MTPTKIGKAGLLLACMAAPAALHAEENARITGVTISPNPVPEHESTKLQIVVESPLTTPVVQPSFDSPDLTVMGAPGLNFQPLNSDAGANTRKRLTFTYVLMPKRTGNFFVRNIRAKAAGAMLSTPDIAVKVVPGEAPSAQAQSSPGSQTDDDESTNPAAPHYGAGDSSLPASSASRVTSAPERFNSDFTVWASLSKTKAYVGEPIVAEYYIYDFGGIRQTEVLKWPTFDGYWKEDLELRTEVQFEDIYLHNQEMRRAFVARYALYGIKPGLISVDKLGIRARYVANEGPAYGIFSFDMRTGQHYSQDISVEVLPLPAEGRPEKFTGAVGKFNLKLEADKTTLMQNTPVTFTVTLSGVGNFQAIEAVRVPLPPDFELYESTANGRAVAPIGVRQELDTKKTFQVIAIPRKAGKFEVPAIEWNFFNPEKKAYEKISTQPIALEVQPNSGGGADPNSYLQPSAGGAGSEAPKEDLRYLKPVIAGASGSWDRALNIAILAALFANLMLGFRFLKSRSKKLYKMVKGMDPFSEARILLLQVKGNREGDWQAGLEEVALQVIQVLLHTNPRGVTKHDLEESWKAKALPAPLFIRLSALLEELDRHRFSSQKLAGSGTPDLRSRLTREAENLLAEAAQIKTK